MRKKSIIFLFLLLIIVVLVGYVIWKEKVYNPIKSIFIEKEESLILSGGWFNKEYHIIGFSKEGKQIKTITIPDKYEPNGYSITQFWSNGTKNKTYNFDSDLLEIIYLTEPVIFIGDDLFNNCPNLEKIICLSKNQFSKDAFTHCSLHKITDIDESKGIYDRYVFEDVHVYSYTDLDVVKEWNLYNWSGNIQYLDSLSDELYYLDFYDGGLISDMPWTPVKDGYTFAGWYKEKECINKWDFDKDEVDCVEYENDIIRSYSITRIYAKWDKNEEIN